MNRRTKIIVSVAGIFIVLLALLGLTYGYFLTRIKGNSNEKSISISTVDVNLLFDDGDNSILGEDTEIYPSSEPIGTKTFSVINENKKRSINYALVIEGVTIKDSSGETTTFESNDFRYTLTCTKKSGGNCNQRTNQTIFPLEDYALIFDNIAADDTNSYTLKMWYIDTGKDQSNDMGKTLEAKLNISTISDSIPGKTKDSLASIIIANALENEYKTGSTYTKFSSIPLTSPGSSVNNVDEKILSSAQDDYGTSYYYRGNVEDNYVSLNLDSRNQCWRIVRIQGDGSVKLILEDYNHNCDSNYYDGNWTIYSGSRGHYGNTLFDWSTPKDSYLNSESSTMAGILKEFQNSLNQSYLKSGDWCLDDSIVVDGDSGISYRFSYNYTNPSLKCETGLLTEFADSTPMYVGTITADEASFAGLEARDSENQNNYLINDFAYAGHGFWTLTPNMCRYTGAYGYSDAGTSYSYVVQRKGYLKPMSIFIDGDNSTYFRPSVILKSDIRWSSGDGTKGNPYKIVEN